jgi:hypothetical protein
MAQGFMVVWRSEDPLTGSKRLLAAPVAPAGDTVGAPVAVTPADLAVGHFDLTADGTRVVVAYLATTGAAADAFAVPLLATGTPAGDPVPMTTGAAITGTIGAAVRGNELVAVWTDAAPGGPLHLARVDLATDHADPASELPQAGTPVSDPGIAVDGALGYVAVFRTASAGGRRVGMLRLDPALRPRDGVSDVGGGEGSEQVRVASRGDGTFAVAWANDGASGTTGALQVVSCP